MNTRRTAAQDSAAATDPYAHGLRKAPRAVHIERDNQIAAQHPHVRTFSLTHADAIGSGDSAHHALAWIPQTLTLVTPDPSDPSADHLLVGPHPVRPRDIRWNAAFEELDFATSDSMDPIRGSLRLSHGRLRAHGVLDLGGESVVVEYRVDPQRFRMRVAKDAAYLSGDQGTITWDTESTRWRNASWSTGYELGFTYGVNGEEVIDNETVYTFVASFDNARTGLEWTPTPLSYGAYLTGDPKLAFALLAGTEPPAGEGTELFPYQLLVKLSEVGSTFAGGMVVGGPGHQGTVYGVTGDWSNTQIGGLHPLDRLKRGERGAPLSLVVDHGRTSPPGCAAAARVAFGGGVVPWFALDRAAA